MRSASVALGLLVVVVLICVHSGWSVWAQAEAWSRESRERRAVLAKEHEVALGDFVREKQVWEARWWGAREGLGVELRARALGGVVLTREQGVLTRRGEEVDRAWRRDDEARVEALGSMVVGSGSVEECLRLLERVDGGLWEGLGGVVSGDVSREARRCREVLREKEAEVALLYKRLRQTEEGVKTRVSALSQRLGQGSEQLETRLLQRVVLGERLNEERVLEARREVMVEGFLRRAEAMKRQHGAELEEVRARGLLEVLEARGFAAWVWWLHLGTVLLGVQVVLVLVLRWMHLMGWGSSLRLRRRDEG